MCGICGVVLRDPQARVSPALIDHMATTIAHRGPDDSGRFVSGPVGLGHRRLSIVDLATGHQPMGNEDGALQIVFNGEIYNHQELRPGLEARGHRFRTRSDTEAILHQYEEDGPLCAARLRGMFAFALWDGRLRRLILARDHTGIKPLYYTILADGSIVFGSEVKALIASGLLEPEVEVASVPEHLAAGHVAGERTLLRGIRKLLPGHILEWRDGQHRVIPYWTLSPAWPASGLGPKTLEEAGEQFWQRFIDSVRSQLMSDVPLGAFLSGGLDSSLLVAAARELGVKDLNTFSVGYEDRASSELPWARLAAAEFGTRHHEVILRPTEFFELLPDLTWHRDLPLSFSASIPLYVVSRLAAQEVKVVLTGEGSDELFAGYGRYPRALINLKGGRVLDRFLPRSARERIARNAGSLGSGYLGSRLRRSFLVLHGTVEDGYLEAFADIDSETRVALTGDQEASRPWSNSLAFHDSMLSKTNPLEALLRLDQCTYLEELLMKQDAMSMAASLESRVPFLDHTLVEWASGLDPQLKLRNGNGKALVRAAAARRLSKPLIAGKKRGFSIPLQEWLRSSSSASDLWAMGRAPHGSLLSSQGLSRIQRMNENGVGAPAMLWRLLSTIVWEGDTLPRLRRLARKARERSFLDETPASSIQDGP